MRGVAASLIVASLFLGFFASAFNVQPAEALYSVVEIDINADGSVTPAGAPINNVNNTFYTLTDDVNCTGWLYPYNSAVIRISRSNIIFNGNGHTLTNSGGDSCFILGGSNVTIENTTAVGFNINVYIPTYNNTIRWNRFSGSGSNDVIRLQGAGNNYFEGNNITNNGGPCIWMAYGGPNNTFVDNYIVNSGSWPYDVAIGRNLGGGGATFYHNLIGGRIEATYPPACIWDNGYPSGGNYWIGYTDVDVKSGPHQNITGPDGIWDHARTIDGDDIDHYPFVVPYETEPPGMTILSPENKTYAMSSGIPLTFAVDESTRWMGYSLDGQANVTITGNATLPTLSDGPHHVFVYANDTFGNMGKATAYFTVDTVPPTANAGSAQTVNEDSVVTFDGSASTDENGIAAYTWTFTDVTPKTLTGKNPTYMFATPGTYTVTLEVTDPAGHTDTHTVTITVRDITKPVANAGSDKTVNEDVPTTLDGSASTDNVNTTGYTWTFTDGTLKTLTGKNPSYTFKDPGIYTITLNVTDAAGNWATDTMVMTVAQDDTDPVADAGQDQTVDVEATVSFDAGGSTDNIGIVSYEWNFGDDTSGTGKTTAHQYTKAGTYTVTLTVKDAAGNQATNTMLVKVTSTEAFPWWIVAAAGIVAGCMAILALIFWKRRKKKSDTTK